MNKLRKIVLPILSVFLLGNIAAQTVFLQEGFENGGSFPAGWTQDSVGIVNWDFFDGGAFATGGDGPFPSSAHSGSYNARFYVQSYSVQERYLISPEFSFEFAQKPELKFWYAQEPGGFPGQPSDNFKLNIYYRTPEEGNIWYLLKVLSDSTQGWVFDSIPIPDSITNKKYKKVQLGFKGINTTYGFGTCIDDIQMVETDTVTKYIDKVYATQPNLDIIPSGSINNPILRLRFPVQGNDGALILDSLVVTGLEKAADVVSANGVKLFHTTTEYFTSTNQIGTAASFVGGKAIFNNINYELPFGNSYVWVTFDIPVDNNHEFKDVKVDAKIEANNIKINGTYFPLSDLSPNGYRKINESVFYDDFESDKSWTLIPEFQIDTAQGKGGEWQYPDPDYAKSGVKILGTDITGLNTHEGDYELGLTADQYQAITPTFNCTYYKDLNIQFYRWLNKSYGDTAGIDYSLDGGVTWKRAWFNNALIAEYEWKFQQLSLSNLLDRNPSVTIRFTLGPTGISQALSGWNIDNFAITGTYVNSDIGVSDLITPLSGCGHVGPENLTVTVKNFGYDPTSDALPVKFSLDNGSTWVTDTVRVSIPQSGTTDFTFTQQIDVSSPGYHRLLVKTDLGTDEDIRNNLLDTTIFATPTDTLPYYENFEANNGYWLVGDKSNTWACGVPSGTQLNHAYSGTKCWVTNLNGNYPNNDTSYIESPCFDFTGIMKPIIEFMLRTAAEIDHDGLAVYYSIDGGNTWTLVPTEGTYFWNWYNNSNIEAFGHEGWDSVSNQWFKVRQILPGAVANQPNVKFRLLFQSNSSIVSEGFAVDDFKLYEAPVDAGVTALITPASSCSLSKTQQITVSIKNYGIRDIKPADPLITKVVINGTKTLIDTFHTTSTIATGGTENFTFSSTADMFNKKWYHLVANTIVPGDTAFYVAGVYNDTLVDSVYVKGEPYYNLGPNIGTLDASSVTLDGGVHSVGGADFTHYNWYYVQKDSTGADQRTFDVPPYPPGVDSLKFKITVENDSGCFVQDSLYIIKSQVDVGISQISGISDGCLDSQSQALSVTIENHSSTYTLPQDTTISVGYKTDESENPTEVIESVTLSSPLAPGGTVDYLFTQQPTFGVAGVYNLSAFTVVDVDLDYSNDTATQAVSIYPMPEVDLGHDSIFTLQADTITLDAGAGFSGYSWNTTAITQTLAIPDNLTDTYSVTVTSSQGCGTASDSVLIVSDNWILESIDNPVTKCTPSSSDQVTVSIKNSGNNTYAIGYVIPASLVVSGVTYNENITLTVDLAPNASFVYTFTPDIDMSTPGAYDITVAINPEHDISRTDNTLSETVNIWGVKVVDIGPDTIITQRADTILLDAGDNFNTYTWQNNTHQSTYQITDQASTRYWVSVTDYNGCPSSKDTVRIMAMDLSAEELVSPGPECDISEINNIIFTLRNTGPDIIPTGESVKVIYIVDGGTPVTSYYSLPFDLSPDQTKQVTINENFGFVAGNSYNFKLYIDWSKDHFNDNDTLTSKVYQLAHPVSNMKDVYTLQPDTVVLNAPKGYTTYLWQNSSKLDNFAVQKNYTSQYWVQIRNAYGCISTDTVMVYSYDLSVNSVQNLNQCDTSVSNNVTMDIQLNSNDTLKAGSTINATYDYDGNPVTETIVLVNNLTKAAVLPYTFATPIVIRDTGNYNLTCRVSLANEVDTTNNSMDKAFRIGAYHVELGNDTITYANSVLLDAGSGFSDYLWSNQASTQTITVTTPGNYVVTVTDVNNCNTSDTINILFMNPGYSITEISGLKDSCFHSASELVSFKLQNTGNDTLRTGDDMSISYKINDSTAINETYTLVSNFTPGAVIGIDFSTNADLSYTNSYTILVSCNINGNTSSLDTVVNTWAAPEIELGEEIESPNDSVVLDAGAGFASYLWSTAATSQTIKVTTTGDYSVTVTNVHGCTGSDVTHVYFLPEKLIISQFVAPLMGCGGFSGDEAVIIIKNSGSKAFAPGTNIIISYEFDNQPRINESVELSNGFKPDANLTYHFKNLLNTTNSGNLPINFYVRIASQDMDTGSYTIPVYERPQFFDGLDTIEVSDYPYTLDPNVDAESYLWNTSATSSTITINNNGNYWVTINQTNTCEFTDTVFVSKITRINDAWNRKISIYPNPGDKEIWVDLPDQFGKVNIQVTDVNGRRIFIKNQVDDDFRLDIHKWKQGVYILRIIKGNEAGIYQIVKQ